MSQELEKLIEELRKLSETPEFFGPQAEAYRQRVANLMAESLLHEPAKLVEFLLALAEEVIKLKGQTAEEVERLRKEIDRLERESTKAEIDRSRLRKKI